MLSASSDDQNTALDEGAQFYIQKPYSKESLLAAVTAALESSDLKKNDESYCSSH
jgi:DNA-binding response OmpR family regulator